PVAEASGSFQGEHRARGRTPEVRRAAGGSDDRIDILDLAGNGIGQRVATVAPTAAVVVVDGELRRQLLGESHVRPAVGRPAADEDQGAARAELVEGDRRAGCRGDLV